MRRRHRPATSATATLLTTAALLLGVGLVAQPAHAAQPDVEAISKVHGAIDAGANSDQLERVLVALVMEQVRTLPGERGYPSSLGLEGEELRDKLVQGVAKLVDGVGRDPRKQAKLLRSLSTRGAAEAIIADHLGFDPPGAYLPELQTKPDKPSLASQVTSGASTSLLALAPERWKIISEVGGPGAGNGMLDAGEWVKLRIALDHVGTRPLFSSSAYVRVEGGCGWADAGQEHLLTEMDPGSGQATVETWLYLSAHCANGSAVPVYLDVFDTHQAPTTPHTLRATLELTNLGAPAMSNVMLDTDTPGSSDGSERRPIAPNQRFEISGDLAVRGPEPTGVLQAYQPEPLADSLFDVSYRKVPMVAAGGNAASGYRFLAGDDLDLVTAGPNGFERALGQHPEASERARDGQTYTFFAVDTQVWLSSPEQSSPAAATAAPEPKPLSTADMVKLIHPFIHLAPRPAATVSSNAAEATDGYEVLFNKDAFGEAYERLVWPEPADTKTTTPDAVPYVVRTYVAVPVLYESAEPSCQIALPRDRQGYEFDDEVKLVGQVLNAPAAGGLEVRWISDMEGLVAKTAIKAQGATNGETVLEAGTHTLTMSATQQGVDICEDQVVIAVRGPRAAPEPEPVEPLDDWEPTRVRLDLGVASASGSADSFEDPEVGFSGDTASLLRVGARLTIGSTLRSTWMVQVAPPSGRSFDWDHDEDKLFQAVLGGGVAYGIMPNEFVVLEPRLTGGITVSTLILANDSNDSTVLRPFLSPGASLILMPVRSFGVHLSMDVEVSGPWKPFDFEPGYEMVSGSGLRPGVGVSFAW